MMCSEKKKNGVLESKLKYLTQQLADGRAAQEKCAIDSKATEDAVSAMEVADKQVLLLTEELLGVKTTHAQEIIDRITEVDG